MFPTFRNLTAEQKQILFTTGLYLSGVIVILIYFIRAAQAQKAYARAMNTFADTLEEGGPVIINVAQNQFNRKDANFDSAEN